MRIRVREDEFAAHLYIDRPEDRPRPMILFCPGLPYEAAQEATTPGFIARGYDVLQIQYIGTYDSSGLFSPESALKSVERSLEMLATQSLCDRKTGAQVAVAQKPIAIAGHSFGSWVALRSLENLAFTRCLAISPYFAFGRDLRHVGSVVSLDRQSEYIATALPLTFRLESKERWHQFFLTEVGTAWNASASTSYTRVLPVVGADDPSFDVLELRSYVDELRDANSAAVDILPLRIIPDGKHDTSTFIGHADWEQTMDAFFQ